jgi:acetylornithine deacetylase/succinyl-diaminopimelate desuccinylase-like protein
VTPRPACGDPVALTKALVAIDSRNPALVPNGPGEGECARALAVVLADWGFKVELHESAAGRPNVVARIGRSRRGDGSGGRSLLFNGHLDTVGVDGMIHAPWDPLVRDGKLYGRGSTDMKAGVAAMVAAAETAAAAGTAGDIVLALVADEEHASIGTGAVLEFLDGRLPDACLVGEPTWLDLVIAHRGYAVVEVTFTGQAAHSSQAALGVNAVPHLGGGGRAVRHAGCPQRARSSTGRGALLDGISPVGGRRSPDCGVRSGGWRHARGRRVGRPGTGPRLRRRPRGHDSRVLRSRHGLLRMPYNG